MPARLPRTLIARALVAGLPLLVACGSDRDSDGPDDPTVSYEGTEVSANEAFTFVPEPPGAVPGIYVEAVVDGVTHTSEPMEVRLIPYEGDVRYERALTGDLGIAFPGEEHQLEAAGLPDATIHLDLPGGFAPDNTPDRDDRLADVFTAQRDVLNAGGPDEKDGDCLELHYGDVVPSIGTFGGRSYWLAQTFTVTEFYTDLHYAWVLHFAPEGLYITLQKAVGASFPGDLAGIGVTQSFGTILPPEAPRFEATTIEGRALSLSMSAGFSSVGFTLFFRDGTTFHTAVQLDMGVGFGLSGFGLIPIPNWFPFSVSVAQGVVDTGVNGAAGHLPGFVFLGGYGQRCGDAEKELELRLASLDAPESLAELGDLLTEAQAQPVTDFASAMRAEIARSALAMVSAYSAPGTTPVEGIPSSSNGAWLGEFGESERTTLCPSCDDMTVEGLARDTVERFQTAGENTERFYGAGFASLAQMQQAWPQPMRHGQAAETAVGAIDAAFALAFENAAELRGDTNRYTTDDVVILEGTAGEPIPFVVTVDEIADLIERPAEDVIGATLCIEGDFSGPRVDPVCTELEEGGLEGAITLDESTRVLLAIRVDLSTAAGDFPEDVADWVVRPALRVVGVEGGAPEALTLSAPQEITGGSPLTLNAMLVDAFGNLAAADATYTFYGPRGEVLGEAASDAGWVSLQVPVEAQTPEVTSLTAQTITFTDGSSTPGYMIEGVAMSRDAQVLIDGQDVSTYGHEARGAYGSLIALLPLEAQDGVTYTPMPTGSARVEVINPGDHSSGVTTLELGVGE